MSIDKELLDAVSSENKCSIVGDGYNSDPQEDDMDSPEEQEHVVSHHNGSNAASYGPLMQLTEVALNLHVEMPVLIEPPVFSPDSEVPIDADPDPIFSEQPSSLTPKGEHMGSPADA